MKAILTACTAAVALLSFAAIAHAQGRCATVEVRNLHTAQGPLMLAAYTDAASFRETAASQMQVPVTAETMQLQVCNLSGDSVAMMAFQDLNSNGKLDTNPFGMPTEPWGSSGTPSPMSAPTWRWRMCRSMPAPSSSSSASKERTMQRRHFLQAFAALTAASSLPAFAFSPEGQAFDAAVADKPWLAPFKGVSDATGDRQCDALALTGQWPAALRGRFYRNGPALYERDGQRYHHWFAGDGMVQQFSFSGGGRPTVSHRGRLVRTPKLVAEQKAGKFLYSAYGTRIDSDEPSQGPDTFNVANTNAIEHAGRVLAMWEGGSAFALRPDDLATLGPVTWQEGLAQMPFSAHPKLDAAGNLWNFGSAGANLVVWHVDPAGKLVNAQIGESPYPGGMAHDAAVSAHYVVLPLPPVKLHFGEDVNAGKAFTYEPNQPLRILVMRKDDIGQRRVFELPTQMVFHVGNAHELADGSIALSFVGSKTPEFAINGASQLLAGHPAAPGGASTQIARLDMRTGRSSVESLGDEVEFPRVHPGMNGLAARYLLTSAAWGRAPQRGSLFQGVQLRDLQTGRTQGYDYGPETVVEEHIIVPRPGARHELDAWLLGSTFDVRRQLTQVNLLDARHIADGPIAQATLPYALPYGFHGNFTAA